MSTNNSCLKAFALRLKSSYGPQAAKREPVFPPALFAPIKELGVVAFVDTLLNPVFHFAFDPPYSVLA